MANFKFKPSRTGAALVAAAALTGTLAFPGLAFAVVRIDSTDLVQGKNVVGGGTATWTDSQINMNDVNAGNIYSDESVSMNFNGGNYVDNVEVGGSANVDVNFSGQNQVDEVHTYDNANTTINATGNNEFEEIEAHDNSNVTINVTGENKFEEIVGYDDANVTVRGTDCQHRDVVNLGEGEKDTEITTTRGNLTIDHVTVNVEGKQTEIGSQKGDVVIDTSKIGKGDDNEYTLVKSGGTLLVRESVLDFPGTVRSEGKMTIDHSDVSATKPDEKYGDTSPYRIWSPTGIDLIREKNGEVKQGKIDGRDVYWVDTDDGENVNLKADGEPAYYRCSSDDTDNASETDDIDIESPLPEKANALPATADATLTAPVAFALAGIAALGIAIRCRVVRGEAH